MIRSFGVEGGRLKALPVGAALAEAVWLDMIDPTEAEEAAVEALVGVDVPTREERVEIEPSSRLYVEAGVPVMTALVPANSDQGVPDQMPVSFLLAGARLVTVREHAPKAIETFPTWATKIALDCSSGTAVLVGLLEAIVGREADLLERSVRAVDTLSRSIFDPAQAGRARVHDFRAVLEALGREGDLISNVRESLVTLERLFGFLGPVLVEREAEKELRGRLKVAQRDARALADHAGFLSGKVTFLLDATLGLVTIEQNGIIKIFSVMAVLFLPPTLVASVYGMNFEFMPELGWRYGYPMALGLMAASAALPLFYFRRRGWL